MNWVAQSVRLVAGVVLAGILLTSPSATQSAVIPAQLAWWEYAVLLTLVAGALVVFVAQVHAFERLLSWLGSRGYGGEQR